MPKAYEASPTATQKWEERYKEILDAAAATFCKKGFLGSSTRDVAERLGIRAASLYYYFPSKDAFLAAICELGVRDFIANVSQIVKQPSPTAEKIHAVVSNHLSPLRSRSAGHYIRVFVRHRHHLPDGPRQTVARLALQYQNLIEEIFTEGVESGQLRAGLDPKLATLALLGLCNSLLVVGALPRIYEVDDFIEEYSRILTEGVTVTRGKQSRTE